MNLELLRSFVATLDAGSINRAAERLHISQSTLSRQLQALEQDIGSRLLERNTHGVIPTATGQKLYEDLFPMLKQFDQRLQEIRRFAQGEREVLRIGYLVSAASSYLNPALSQLRAVQPNLRLELLDMSPGEQITALRNNGIDLAIMGPSGALLEQEFYTRRISKVSVMVVLPDSNKLAAESSVDLSALRNQPFIGAPESDMPDYNQSVVQLCRKANFRPRFILNADSLSHALSMVISESAVMLLPHYHCDNPVPGVHYLPLKDPVQWDFYVAWQRGKIAESVKTFLSALSSANSDQRG